MVRSPEASAQGLHQWLLLIHQLPPKPDYLRVKVRRRLHKLGAVLLKNSVYVLPLSESTLEDFQWLAIEIVADGGDATICSASLLSGVSDDDLAAVFRAQRASDHVAVAHGDGRRLHTPSGAAAGPTSTPPSAATWVTRSGVFVDRMASAWLIRRFIDPAARFRFVAPGEYQRAEGDIRFDMYRAEFTHVGDRCTFETLSSRFIPEDAALRSIGEIVHDIDCKDEKFGREETPGIAAVLHGIAIATDDDLERVRQGSLIFDGLYGRLCRSGSP